LILPAEMHDVQTLTFMLFPSGLATRAVWRFGSHRRRDLLFAWLTLLPEEGPFPQTLQILAIDLILSGLHETGASAASYVECSLLPA